MKYTAFKEAFNNILKKNNIYRLYQSPDIMVGQYKKFAQECYESGYDDFLAEFDNDIFVRKHIEIVLESTELTEFEEFNSFLKKINEVDAVLRNAFILGQERSEGHTWWERGILKKGIGNYADDVKETYGIEI